MSRELQIGIKEHKLNYETNKRPLKEETGPDGKPMPKMTIDGVTVSFKPGDTIMNVAERAGLAPQIPRYCYHPGMSVAGTCRMCTVEIEKSPKLMTSCSTPAADGMVVHTKSEKVLKSRTGVMEFLLASHPLDCPVCDKAGECELQDYNFEYGPSTSRFSEDKRVFKEATTRHLSDKITLNMNRCVNCERCVRFTQEVTGTYDLFMHSRGWKKELTVGDPEKGLYNDYQGNVADICPVGALTWNDFRFQKRSWFLTKKDSICDGCSKGCNTEVHSEKNVIYRQMPRYNEKVNGHWICDEGRANYHTVSDPARLAAPMAPYQGKLHATQWEIVIQQIKAELQKTKKVLAILGTDTSNEEAKLLQKSLSSLTKATVDYRFYNGSSGVLSSSQDQKIDQVLRMKDKTPNTKGLEAQGLRHLSEDDLNSADLVFVLRFGRAGIPQLKQNNKAVFWGVFNLNELKAHANASTVAFLPGLATAEKSGSFTNCDGLTQGYTPAVGHKGMGLPVSSVLEMLAT